MEGELPDLIEIKLIINNLEFLEKELPIAIGRWKNHIKNCDWARIHLSRGILRALCENPKILHEQIFAPVYTFLRVYMGIRDKSIAYAGKKLDNLFREGLNSIQRYLVVSDFFADNPQYFVPGVSVTHFQKHKESQTNQNKYREYIKTLNERLIGCKDINEFKFLKLLDTVKSFPSGTQKLFKANKDYLEQMCIDIHTTKLKI